MIRLLKYLGLLHLIGCQVDKSLTTNSLPKANILSPSVGDSILEGFVTDFVGNVTDANHSAEELTTIWYVDGVEVCPPSAPNALGETRCDIVLLDSGSEVTLAVLDPDNGRGEHTLVYDIEPTAAPSAAIVTPVLDGVYYSDSLIHLKATCQMLKMTHKI